jgi:hypothetical protein
MLLVLNPLTISSTQLVVGILVGLAATVLTLCYGPTRAQPSDFAQLWFAARAWWRGADPYYAIGPGKAFDWPFPLLYPMTAVLAALPFSVLPLSWADATFVGLGMGLFAYAVTGAGQADPRLLMGVSGAGILALQTAQWSPLLSAGAFVPAVAPFWACKPTLGLALLAAYPSTRAVAGMAALTAISLLAWPSWPWQWLDAIKAGTHIIAPIARPGGWLIVIALVRWRLPEARLLVAWACMPQTPVMYEAVPLFLTVKTWRESAALCVLTILAAYAIRHGGQYQDYQDWMHWGGFWMLWLVYIPASIWVAFRTTREAAPP